MQLIDSHCHLNMLDLAPYQGSLPDLIQTTYDNGIIHMLCVGIDLVHAATVISIAEQFTKVSASVGLHPNEKVEKEPTLLDLTRWAMHPKVIAIGETGLDYFHTEVSRQTQQDRFRLHIAAAKQLNKPLIIHSRDAREDTIRILQEEKAQSIGGVMHCFTENWEMAQQALALNFYISFSGIVTFKNALEVASVAQKVPLERLLIETDAPYLTPVPYRGKKSNEPQYVRFVAQRLAELRNLPVQDVAHHTTKNFFDLFNLK